MVRKSIKYPCGVCNKNCVGCNDIACEKCNKWFHTKCEGLSKVDFGFLSSTDLEYVCSSCMLPEGSFNFDAALARLTKAVSVGNIFEAAKLESIFLRNQPVCKTRATLEDCCNGVDNTALCLLGNKWNGGKPVSVSGNGNCLFNAVSMSIYGNESLATELRVRVAIELSLNSSFYERINENAGFEDCSPTIQESINACAIDREYSSIWAIHAASTVIQSPINSVYPVVNGPADEHIGILNTTLVPRLESDKRNAVTIMWTGPKTISNRMWRPNHFVPIINGSINEESVVNVSDTGSESGTFEFNDMESDSNINAENCETAEVLTSPSKLTDTESDRICKLSESFTEEGSDDQILDVTEISVSHPYQNPTENGINNFLNTEEQYCLVKNSQAVDLTCIPRGIKENVFFLINDRQNVERRNLGKKSEYPDDCGAWDGAKSSTKTEYFIKQNSKLRMIKRRTDGTYFVIAKKEEIALSPQPSSDEVIIVKRLYSKLKRDPSYKRRITYFVSGISPDVAVVEYLGSYPKNVPHGNSLNNSAPYRRVNSKQKALIKNELVQ